MTSFLTPTFIISVLIALSVHEWAHGFVAYKLGDATAKMEGRLTLNPIAHLDPIGTLLFILVGFGWGKPVPVDPRYFKNVKRDTALVSIAGPISNLLMALFAFGVLLLVERQAVMGMASAMVVHGGSSVFTQLTSELMIDFLHINLVLMAFNLLPIAPLDGSKILRAFIPLKYEYRYEDFMQQGPKILLILILLGQLFHVPILSVWIGVIVAPVLKVFGVVAGLL
ncbi:site-2 protease family protein [Candidatus Peregrinibacteria bacterium CG10_big_fil_rev_8_21_14_0_10_49_10]|nr:MAG: site-2 protease family protein [Candidatus Peregrinibacteria bacterium CG10_big_fil_rev_8_21_14_0_10_49_10]